MGPPIRPRPTKPISPLLIQPPWCVCGGSRIAARPYNPATRAVCHSPCRARRHEGDPGGDVRGRRGRRGDRAPALRPRDAAGAPEQQHHRRPALDHLDLQRLHHLRADPEPGPRRQPHGLVAAYPSFTVPFVTWLLMRYFESIPEELEEAAMIDGATRFGAFRRVILPLAGPGVLAAGLYAFTQAWNEFLYALVFITNVKLRTLPVGLSSFITGDVYGWGYLMEGAVLTNLPVIVVYILLNKFIVEGLTAGSVKG